MEGLLWKQLLFNNATGLSTFAYGDVRNSEQSDIPLDGRGVSDFKGTDHQAVILFLSVCHPSFHSDERRSYAVGAKIWLGCAR